MSKRTKLFLFSILFLSTTLSFNSVAGPVCGDGNVEGDEECDTGMAATSLCNNNTDPAGGNGPCMFTICGDNILQSPNGVGFNEECEPPNTASCDNICQSITTTTSTTTTTAATTTTTAATTSTTGATTSTTGGTTSTTGATTSTTGATTSTTAATTSTTGATTTTTMGGGGTTTTTTAASTTTTAASTTTTAGATTTTQVPGQPSVDVPLTGGAGTVTITTAAGETISNVSATKATDAPSGINFPFGTISYTTSSPVGGSVALTFEFSTDLPDNLILYKVDNNGVYSKLSRNFPEANWTRINARTVEVIVTDGDPLTDQDGLVNGSIEDPLAVGTQPMDTDSGGGGGGCSIGKTRSAGMDPIWLFLLLAPGIGILRRRLGATGESGVARN